VLTDALAMNHAAAAISKHEVEESLRLSRSLDNVSSTAFEKERDRTAFATERDREERASRAHPGRTSSRQRREPRQQWVEQGANAELPLLGGGSRSMFLLSASLMAPFIGLLMLLCCRPMAIVFEEVASLRRFRLLRIGA